MKYLLIVLFIVGCCGKEEIKKPKAPELVDRKYCVSFCVKHEFKNFHHSGSSWGTKSSSMNGLGQTNIYKAVYKRCMQFYPKGSCYNVPYGFRYKGLIHNVHDYYYGELR